MSGDGCRGGARHGADHGHCGGHDEVLEQDAAAPRAQSTRARSGLSISARSGHSMRAAPR